MRRFDTNSVGAPYDTPIIWPAQPPRILFSSSARDRRRAEPDCAGATTAHAPSTIAAIANVQSLRMSSLSRQKGAPSTGAIGYSETSEDYQQWPPGRRRI